MPMRQERFAGPNASGTALDDYGGLSWAQASVQGGAWGGCVCAARAVLRRSIRTASSRRNAPVLLANAYLQQNDPQGALRVLLPRADTPEALHADFRYALGRAYQTSGDTSACGFGLSELVRQSAFEYGSGTGARADAGD